MKAAFHNFYSAGILLQFFADSTSSEIFIFVVPLHGQIRDDLKLTFSEANHLILNCTSIKWILSIVFARWFRAF